jgi:hypothetical protein
MRESKAGTDVLVAFVRLVTVSKEMQRCDFMLAVYIELERAACPTLLAVLARIESVRSCPATQTCDVKSNPQSLSAAEEAAQTVYKTCQPPC